MIDKLSITFQIEQSLLIQLHCVADDQGLNGKQLLEKIIYEYFNNYVTPVTK
jgi:hypothetical protein